MAEQQVSLGVLLVRVLWAAGVLLAVGSTLGCWQVACWAMPALGGVVSSVWLVVGRCERQLAGAVELGRQSISRIGPPRRG